MKRRDHRSLLVTGSFLLVLLGLIAAGLAPVIPAVEAEQVDRAAAAPASDRYVPDAQFVQYLEYRVRLENSSNCQ